MPNDLDYFRESMLKGSLVDFLNRLPTRELKDKFVASMGGLNFFDRDSWNVLQGYQGPHANSFIADGSYLAPNDGLQEVRYWWGTSKQIRWIPVVGFIAWLIGRLFGNTNWHSNFFDSKTGECLSHSKETAASKLNTIGETLIQTGKFDEAKEYFSNAYAHSTDSTNRNRYKENINRAQNEIHALNLNSKGEELFNQGKYTEAKAKFETACSISNNRKHCKVYECNRDRVQAEIDALNLNCKGGNLFNQSKYAEAYAKYQSAYGKSSISERGKQNNGNNDKAHVEIYALNFSSEGNNLFQQGKYTEARAKYQAAYDISQVSEQHVIYKNKIVKTQEELDALHLNSEGDNLFNQRKYEDAVAKYQAAYDKSNVSEQHVMYKSNIDKTQEELDAINLNSEGDQLFDQGKYEEAVAKYQAAYDKSNVSEQHGIYKSNIDKTQEELNALHLNSEGKRKLK